MSLSQLANVLARAKFELLRNRYAYHHGVLKALSPLTSIRLYFSESLYNSLLAVVVKLLPARYDVYSKRRMKDALISVYVFQAQQQHPGSLSRHKKQMDTPTTESFINSLLTKPLPHNMKY
jgi:hypothetical protein